MATSTKPQTEIRTNRCPRCLGTDIDHSPTETWCRDCGFVLEDSPIDRGPDWRSFADDDHNAEHAAPGNRNHPHRGLGTDIRLGPTSDRDDARREKIHRHSKKNTKTDANRGYATTEIQRMGSALELPQYAVSRAKFLFRELHRDGLNGYDLDTVAAGCLIAACREDGLGRTVADIAAVARTEERQVARRYRWIASKLDVAIAPPDPLDRLNVVAGELGLQTNKRTEASERIDALADSETVGIDPSIVVAAVLDDVTDRTQREVCTVAKVSRAGMREFRDSVINCSG